MCLGIPMQVVKAEGWQACCAERDGVTERAIDCRLVGPVSAGQWLLVFCDAAQRLLDEREARQILAALEGLAAAQRGDFVAEEWFADLLAREPQLPEHLR